MWNMSAFHPFGCCRCPCGGGILEVRTRVRDSFRRRPVQADYAKPLAESRSSGRAPDTTASLIRAGLVCGRSGSAIGTPQLYGRVWPVLGGGALRAGITPTAPRPVLSTRHPPQAKDA